METLWRRKFKRSHLGKASYESRGVTPAEYAVYWDSYVWPRWMEHGEARIPGGTLRIDCLLPVEDQVTQLFATDWFAPLIHQRRRRSHARMLVDVMMEASLGRW